MADAAIAFFGGPRLVLTPEQQDQETQDRLDRFAAEHGPCCAGCDHWRWHNSVVGECLRTAPVAGVARVSMLRIRATSMPIASGHIMTPREHWCGEYAADHVGSANKMVRPCRCGPDGCADSVACQRHNRTDG